MLDGMREAALAAISMTLIDSQSSIEVHTQPGTLPISPAASTGSEARPSSGCGGTVRGGVY